MRGSSGLARRGVQIGVDQPAVASKANGDKSLGADEDSNMFGSGSERYSNRCVGSTLYRHAREAAWHGRRRHGRHRRHGRLAQLRH